MKKEKRKVYLDEKFRKQELEKEKKQKEKSSAGSKVSPADKSESRKDENYGKNLSDLPKFRKQELEKEKKQKEKSSAGSKVSPADKSESQKDENYGKNLSDLPKCIWKLITNWIFLVSCLAACCELVIVSGFIVFLPKYLETQFNLSKSEASMLTGGTAIPGACIGIILGGYILKKLQLGPKGAVQLVLICNVFN